MTFNLKKYYLNKNLKNCEYQNWGINLLVIFQELTYQNKITGLTLVESQLNRDDERLLILYKIRYTDVRLT